MFSQNRTKGIQSYIMDDITECITNEIENNDFKSKMLDPVITHVIMRLQPWILTLMVVFGLYFILILAILILIIRNDIKK